MTIREQTGTAQTNLPLTLMAVIARSEIPGYARPALTIYNQDGSVYWARSVVDSWQSDVKTRWRDAVAQRTITAVSNPATNVCPTNVATPCADTSYVFVTSPGHGFRDGERVRIQDSATPELNGSWTVVDRTDDTFAMAGLASVSTPGATGGFAVGPADGSWATGLVTLFIPDLPARGYARIDFVNDPQPSHAPSDTGLTRSQLLLRPWEAVMDVGTPVKAGERPTYTTNARTILESAPESECGLKKWLSGPLVTEYILEDNCSAASPPYDFGWMPVGPNTGFRMASVLPASQSDGSQTFELSNVDDIDVTQPVLMQYKTGGPSPASANHDIEYFTVCAKSGNTLTVCNNGRGSHGSDRSKSRSGPREIPVGAIVGVIQSKEADDLHKNLHPSFIVTAYTNPNGSPFPGVRIRFILSNNNSQKPGTSYVAVTMKTSQGAVRWKSGLPVAEYAARDAEHYFMQAATRDSKVFWDGDDPEHYCAGGSGSDPCVAGERTRRWLLDPNLKYKIYAGFIMPFDQTEMSTRANSSFDTDYKKFVSGDRGDTASMMNKQGNYGWDSDPSRTVDKHYPWTIRAQGLSIYSKDSDDTSDYSGVAHDEDREEGWVWPRVLARTLPVLGTEPRAWEMLFGTSVPGGAGLRAAEHHLPIHWVEGDVNRGSRQYSFATCKECTAFGRALSIDVRPTIYYNNLTYAAPDRVNYPAWTSSAALWYYYAAPGMALVGYTSLDHAHRMPHAPYLYLLTGEYFDLLEVQNWASFLLAYTNFGRTGPVSESRNSGELRHGNWGVMIHGDAHPRTMAWPIMSVSWAAALSPNVPQFGASYPPPDRFLYESKLAKTFQAWEGMVGMTDGSFPPRDSSCSGIAWSTATSGLTTERTNDVWCWSRQQNGRNLPMPLNIVARPSSMNGSTSNSATANATTAVSKSSGVVAPYTMFQLSMALWQTKRLGYSFTEPMFYRNANWLTNFFVNSQTNNVYRATYYSVPWLAGPTEYTYNGLDGPETVKPYQFYPSWGAWVDALDEKARNPATWESQNRTIVETGYAHYARAALASLVGLGIVDTATPGCRPVEKSAGCSADEAYAAVVKALPNTKDYADQKRVAQEPEERIKDLAIEGAAEGAVVKYTPPSQAACTFSIGSSAAGSSLDSDENRDSEDGSRRVIVLPGLTLNQTYYLRITCGNARTQIELVRSF